MSDDGRAGPAEPGSQRRSVLRPKPELEHFTPPSDFMTAAEVAQLLRTTRKAVYARIARGLLPGVIKDGRRRLVEREVLIEWLTKRRATSPGEPER
jgi:excisionase family DNA binding protein